MKKYFTKYLPVEGEIREGDFYLNSVGGISQAKCELDTPLANKYNKKVKLFLCSRDIQAGDKIWHEFSNTFVEIGQEYIDTMTEEKQKISFKVIGEISHNAVWVKEGDEFDEDEVNITEQCPHYNNRHMWKDCSCKTGFVKGVYIKCPTCKTFH